MARKHRQRRHTDPKFIRGFGRYLDALKVVEARDWNDLSKVVGEARASALWREFQLLNFIKIIENKLCSVLKSLYENRQLTNEGTLYWNIFERSARARGKKWKSGDAATKARVINRERARLKRKYRSSESDGKLLLNPAVLLDEAGCTISGLNELLQHGLDHSAIVGIRNDLTKIEEYRNQFCHNIFSSRRVPYGVLLREGIKTARKVLEKIDQHFRIRYASSPLGQDRSR